MDESCFASSVYLRNLECGLSSNAGDWDAGGLLAAGPLPCSSPTRRSTLSRPPDEPDDEPPAEDEPPPVTSDSGAVEPVDFGECGAGDVRVLSDWAPLVAARDRAPPLEPAGTFGSGMTSSLTKCALDR